MLKNVLKTLKINHYIKNLIVFVPLIFSLNFLNLPLVLKACVCFVAFCLMSSCVYVLNDLIDIKKDKLHPVKCKRPIASGAISKKFAIFLLILLLVSSSYLSIVLNLKTFLAVISYFILNVFYSFYLKNIALIDAASIAFGFILRVIAGCFAILVLPSPLVILLTFFVSMFFTFTKRKLELSFVEKENLRKSISNFNLETANQFVLINAILSISFYLTYVLDVVTVEKTGTQYLYLTAIPFTLIIFRLLFLINTTKIEDDPIHFVEGDKALKCLFVFYLVVLAVVLLILK